MTHDLDTGRTFGALPPVRGRVFATSWWGRAWLQALEDTALDGEQVRAGRRHARVGAVGAVSVRPGRVTALVHDRDGTPYRADVMVQQLAQDDWDRFVGLVAGRAEHLAALLDRDLPPHMAEDAAAAGVDLLPGIGDLEPECACGAWDHCAHTAALCHQVARLLDQDPFVLLLLRGRGEREVLDELEARSAARSAGPVAGEPVGVPAREVFAGHRRTAALPAPPPPVEAPGRPPALSGDLPAPPGLDVAALEFLAADAARRARLLLAEALAPGHDRTPVPPPLTVREDAVRLAADGAPGTVTDRLAAGCGGELAGLARAVRAWRFGGPAALSVLDEEWTPEPGVLAQARDRLAAAWEGDGQPPRLAGAANRWTAVGTGVQLRYGRDGRWWPYRCEDDGWEPAGPGGRDPVAVLAGTLVED
ncbi:SWF or SNF family helicase [Streptomyces sp. ET3-23]|uniref:SWF or SNF family helicase n=1 Tax=Streptomyces sp. ET3-23 TaxID=2885643 RepID=UPI001D10C623|nr:SWF or SNF family helicase [Streptomyces sp. ET3-23]MCC2277923.1 SWF or SNF family helicase [Streptomyces sp. ET3-23]